jgi:cytochrome c biogenesis protein CcdA
MFRSGYNLPGRVGMRVLGDDGFGVFRGFGFERVQPLARVAVLGRALTGLVGGFVLGGSSGSAWHGCGVAVLSSNLGLISVRWV